MIEEKINQKTWQVKWTIRKFHGDIDADYSKWLKGEAQPFEVSEVADNLLLNEGIQLLLDLLIGAGGTAYNNTNARLGVGDSSTAESASQTALQAATNKAWAGMEATYPSRASQTVTWRAVFGTSAANFAWNEFTIVNAADDTGTNLNRKVSSQGTKASGQTWTLDMTLTIS